MAALGNNTSAALSFPSLSPFDTLRRALLSVFYRRRNCGSERSHTSRSSAMIVTKPLTCLPDFKTVIFSDHKAASQKKGKGGWCGDGRKRQEGRRPAGNSAVVSPTDWGARGPALCNSATHSSFLLSHLLAHGAPLRPDVGSAQVPLSNQSSLFPKSHIWLK